MLFISLLINECSVSAQITKYLIPIVVSDKVKIPPEYGAIKTFPLKKKDEQLALYCSEAYSLLQKKKKFEASEFVGSLSWKKEGGFDTIQNKARQHFVDSWNEANKSIKAIMEKQFEPKYFKVLLLTSTQSSLFVKALKV